MTCQISVSWLFLHSLTRRLTPAPNSPQTSKPHTTDCALPIVCLSKNIPASIHITAPAQTVPATLPQTACKTVRLNPCLPPPRPEPQKSQPHLTAHTACAGLRQVLEKRKCAQQVHSTRQPQDCPHACKLPDLHRPPVRHWP